MQTVRTILHKRWQINLSIDKVRLEYVKAHILDKGFAFQSRLSSWLAKKEGHGCGGIDVTQIKQIVEALLQRGKVLSFC